MNHLLRSHAPISDGAWSLLDQEARERLTALYGDAAESDADVVVALGGDGFMLEVLHRNLATRRPIYGMNRGSVGFLMNDYREEGLTDRIAAAEEAAARD